MQWSRASDLQWQLWVSLVTGQPFGKTFVSANGPDDTAGACQLKERAVAKSYSCHFSVGIFLKRLIDTPNNPF